MSKLTEFQLRSMIERLDLTAASAFANSERNRGLRAREKAYQYRLELAERRLEKSGQLDPSQIESKLLVSTNQLEKTGQIPGQKEPMEAKKTVLEVAGDELSAGQDAAVELGKWIGRRQAFGMIAAKASAADAQCLKRIKDGAEYKVLDLTWEQFCVQHLGIDRKTAERIIANFEEFGAAYFNLSAVTRISSGGYRLIAGAVDESTIELDGERIPITKANAARIAEAVSALKKTVEQKDERAAEMKRDTDKLRNEKNAASKGAEKARQDLLDYKKKQAERWVDATEEQALLLDAQSHFDFAMAKLAAVYKRDLNDADQGRYIGLTEYMYRNLIQCTFDARNKYGSGWNMAEPGDLMSLDQVAPNPRNLVHEITVEKSKK